MKELRPFGRLWKTLLELMAGWPDLGIPSQKRNAIPLWDFCVSCEECSSKDFH
jgi:hypothetical protein